MRKSTKRVLALLVGIVAAVTASAQFDPQMGQYMYMPTSYNPGAVGEGGLMKNKINSLKIKSNFLNNNIQNIDINFQKNLTYNLNLAIKKIR